MPKGRKQQKLCVMDKTNEFLKDVERVVKSFNDKMVEGQSLVVIATDEINESQYQTIISIRGAGRYVARGLSKFIGENKELMALAMVMNQFETMKNNNDNE